MVGAWSSRPGLSGLAVTAAAGHALYLLDVLAVSFAVLTLEAEIHPALVAAVGSSSLTSGRSVRILWVSTVASCTGSGCGPGPGVFAHLRGHFRYVVILVQSFLLLNIQYSLTVFFNNCIIIASHVQKMLKGFRDGYNAAAKRGNGENRQKTAAAQG
jgi:hypothetical protein